MALKCPLPVLLFFFHIVDGILTDAHRDEIGNIILNGGEKCLRPERRFDQSVYFNRFIDEDDVITNQL